MGEILGGKCFIDALLAHFYSKSFFMAGEWRGFISSQLEADKKLFFRNLDQLLSQLLGQIDLYWPRKKVADFGTLVVLSLILLCLDISRSTSF